MPLVKFTSNLKRFYPDLQTQNIEGSNVSEILEKVDKKYPGIKDYIVDEQGQLREHVNVFIGNNIIKDKKTLKDEVGEQDEVYFMQALSGG